MLKIRSTLVNFFVFWELGLLILNFAQCIFGLFVLFTYWQDLYWSHETSFHYAGFPKVLHIHDAFLQCNYNILLALNLNWREGGHFPPPCPFWIRFCQLNFYQKFLNFFGGQTLGGAKDDHFSCFHSSGLTGVFRFLCSVITTIGNQENLNFIIWGCIPRRKTSCVTNAIFEPLLQLKLTDMFDR